jgi:hypothetical protein
MNKYFHISIPASFSRIHSDVEAGNYAQGLRTARTWCWYIPIKRVLSTVLKAISSDRKISQRYGFLRRRRAVATTDALSCNRTPYLIQNKSLKRRASQDPEDIHFQECRLHSFSEVRLTWCVKYLLTKCWIWCWCNRLSWGGVTLFRRPTVENQNWEYGLNIDVLKTFRSLFHPLFSQNPATIPRQFPNWIVGLICKTFQKTKLLLYFPGFLTVKWIWKLLPKGTRWWFPGCIAWRRRCCFLAAPHHPRDEPKGEQGVERKSILLGFSEPIVVTDDIAHWRLHKSIGGRGGCICLAWVARCGVLL